MVLRNDVWPHLNTEKVRSDVRALQAHLAAGLELTASTANFNESSSKRYIARLFGLYRGDCLSAIDD